jgi:hypothetical protein
MSMTLSEFNTFTQIIIDLVIQLFSVLDQAVIIDTPRFSLFNFLISVIFLSLMIEVINWLRGAHGSGGSRWEYIMQHDGLRNVPDSQLDDSFLRDIRQRQQTVVRYYDNKSPDEMEMWSPGNYENLKRGGRW